MDAEEMPVSIGKAAEILGVSVKTVRRWSEAGKLRFERSPSGHRRYYVQDVKRVKPKSISEVDGRITINYARVSSHDQKSAVYTQSECIEVESWMAGGGVGGLMVCSPALGEIIEAWGHPLHFGAMAGIEKNRQTGLWEWWREKSLRECECFPSEFIDELAAKAKELGYA
jgi:excisionase family DNA binding protein